MASNSLPNDPSKRRAILILPQHEIDRCKYDAAIAESIYDEEAYILPFPLTVEENSIYKNLRDTDLLRPGNILIQNPFNLDHYENAIEAPQRFALAKHMYFSAFCMSLGAKSVTVDQVDLRTKTGKTTFNVNGDSVHGSTEGSVQFEDLEKFRAELSLEDQFVGSEPDLDDAEELLRRHRLLADPSMQTLLLMRRGGNNQLVSRTLTLSLSNEARSNLKVAGRIKGKVPAFNLSADYDRVIQEEHSYTLTVTVRF